MALPVKEMGASTRQFNRRFGMWSRKLGFTFTDPPEGVSDIEWLGKGIKYLVDFIKNDSLPSDLIGMTFNSSNLTKGQGYIAFQPAFNVEAESIYNVIYGLVQSNRDDMASWKDRFEIYVTKIRLPESGETESTPKESTLYNSFLKDCKNRRSIVCIDNSDYLSLPKALVVGKALRKHNPEYEVIRKNRKKRQLLEANKLLAKTGVVIPKYGAGLRELSELTNHFYKYNVIVYDYTRNGRDILYETKSPEAKYTIMLLHCNGHYNLVTK